MKKLLVLSLTFVGLVVALTSTEASGCRVVVRRHVPAVVVAAPVVAVQAVAVAVPLYSVSYGGGDTQALLAEIQKLRADVASLRGGAVTASNATPLPTPAAAPAGGLFSQRCAACHTGAAAKGGVKLFDAGRRVDIAPELLGDVIDAVTSRKMPPTPIPDGERLALVSELLRSK